MPTTPTVCRSTLRRLTVTITATVIAFSATQSTTDAAPLTDDCEPVTCLAEYLGVTPNVVTAAIVTKMRNSNGLGHQRALDLLAEAADAELAAIAPAPRAELVGAYWVAVTRHDHLRSAIIDVAAQAIGTLRS